MYFSHVDNRIHLSAAEAQTTNLQFFVVDDPYPDPKFYDQQSSQGNGGKTVATDPAVQQVLDQNALIADALYDLVKVATTSGTADVTALLQDAKTKVNALNPTKFVFP